MARSSQPYHVREVDRVNFYDTHKLAKTLNTTLQKSVQWMKVKRIRASRDSPDSVEIKEDYDEQYKTVHIRPQSSERMT